MESGQCLTDSELMKALRARNILGTYQFKESITRQTTTVDFAAQSGRGVEDLEFRGNFLSCLRTIGRQLQNELNGE